LQNCGNLGRFKTAELLTCLFAEPESRRFTTSQKAVAVYKNTMVLRQLWPRSSETFTALQSTVWDKKEAGQTFQSIQEHLLNFPDPNQEGATIGLVGTSSLHSCIRRTVMGRRWSPHQRTGRPRFLNLDEEIKLLEWVNQQQEPPTIDELLAAAIELRQVGLVDVELVLQRRRIR
jgi:hypothetical protein